MTKKLLAPIHPGEILKPMNISQYRLAKDINVPVSIATTEGLIKSAKEWKKEGTLPGKK